MGAATVLDPVRRMASAQGAKPTISFWNGLTGADGKVMGDLIGQFTKETGIQVELQMIVWPDLYAKLQVSTPAGEGPTWSRKSSTVASTAGSANTASRS